MWAPEIPVTVIHGGVQQRKWAWNRPEFPVKIANYEAILRDAQLVDDGTIGADLVVLDEAQRIKNSASSTSQVIRGITRRRAWALTGTPIENSTDDLVGIFEFVMSGILRRGMTPRNMTHATRDYILRRTKDDVLTDLPPKLFRDATLDLTPQQHASYAMAEDEGIVRLEGMGRSITIQHVFELILRLKQICNFDPATGESSKLERLEADLEEVAQSGKKAIVFSQWVNTLEKLNDRLQRFNPLQYHGRISGAAREQAIHDFRESDERTVLLISYGAGSVGLNLQFSNYVFLFDRWWNPAIEDQAINRAHRIGSSAPVTITRFVTPGTIEQRIDDILREKRALMHMILDNQNGPAQTGLSQNDIFGLFDLTIAK
jgi:SNF2 family DNA or RNA helicase